MNLFIFFPLHFYAIGVFYRNCSSLAPSSVSIAKSRYFRRFVFGIFDSCLVGSWIFPLCFFLLSPSNSQRVFLSYFLISTAETMCPKHRSFKLCLLLSPFPIVHALICSVTFLVFWNIQWSLPFKWLFQINSRFITNSLLVSLSQFSTVTFLPATKSCGWAGVG